MQVINFIHNYPATLKLLLSNSLLCQIPLKSLGRIYEWIKKLPQFV